MKGLTVLCFLFVLSSAAIGQEQRLPPAPKNGERAFIQFVMPNPKVNVLPHVGIPYFLPDWEKAALTTYEGQVFSEVRMKYNINNGSLWYQPSFSLDSALIKDKFITQFTITTQDNKAYFFKKAEKVRGKKSGKYFYLVLVPGKYTLLALPEKVETQLPKSPVLTTKDQPVVKYLEKVTYQVQVDDEEPVKLKNKKSRQAIFSLHWGTLEGYVASEKLSWTDEADLIKIVGYYNSLF